MAYHGGAPHRAPSSRRNSGATHRPAWGPARAAGTSPRRWLA
eukprot:gene40929-3633_t